MEGGRVMKITCSATVKDDTLRENMVETLKSHHIEPTVMGDTVFLTYEGRFLGSMITAMGIFDATESDDKEISYST